MFQSRYLLRTRLFPKKDEWYKNEFKESAGERERAKKLDISIRRAASGDELGYADFFVLTMVR